MFAYLRSLLIPVICLLGMHNAYTQTVQPAEFKKFKKIEYSHKYTSYVEYGRENVPNMRIPPNKIQETQSPAAGYILEVQDLLSQAQTAYTLGKAVLNLDKLYHNIVQIKELDGYWEHRNYKMEADFYQDYERERYQREVIETRRQDSLRQIKSRMYSDSIKRVLAQENRRADSLERLRVAYKESKKDSIIKAQRTVGYKFVNAKELNLRVAPYPDAEIIVNLRACTYVKVLNESVNTNYALVEVSDYTGYVLKGFLVDNLDKIGVKGADIKFAKENFYVAIYIPAGAAYDPLRPHNGGEIPKAMNPNDKSLSYSKAKEPKAKVVEIIAYNEPKKVSPANTEPKVEYVPVVKTAPASKPAPETPKEPAKLTEAEIALAKAKDAVKNAGNVKPNKPAKGSTKLHQCDHTDANGVQCTNMTTSKSHKCYRHEE